MKSSVGLIVIVCNKVCDIVSFISFILWCIFYSCILSLKDLYTSFCPVFKLLRRVLPNSMHGRDPELSSVSQPTCKVLVDLTPDDVELVMEKLGLGVQGPLEAGVLDFDSMFGEDSEPGLGEVREAFGVFDENKDGYIDAGELNRVMGSLGLVGFSQEQVDKMIMAFDEDGDGRIDFREFVKLMEDCC